VTSKGKTAPVEVMKYMEVWSYRCINSHIRN